MEDSDFNDKCEDFAYIETGWRNTITLKKDPFKAFTIQYGVEVETSYKIKVDTQKDEVGLWSDNKLLMLLKKADIFTLLKQIEAMARGITTYATFKNYALFNLFYPIEIKGVQYFMNPNKQESTRTCMKCGIILPERLFQMDHQRPKVGGGNEAITKVFRVLGLTEAPPIGPKCNVLREAFIDSASRKDPNDYILIFTEPEKFSSRLVKKGISWAATPGARTNTSNQSLEKRYTMNYQGMIIYSIIKLFGKEDVLKDYSIHSIINIRPLCSSCNVGRSNKDLKFKNGVNVLNLSNQVKGAKIGEKKEDNTLKKLPLKKYKDY